MSRVVAVAAVVMLLLAGVSPALAGGAATKAGPEDVAAPATASGDAVTPTASAVAITGIYPNPVADGDRGEFVVLRVAPDTRLGQYRLEDDEGGARLPNVTVGGRVAVTDAPRLVRNLTDLRVVEVTAFPSLANGGEPVRVTRGGESVATARYRDAPEGRIGRIDDRGAVRWRPLGRTNRSVVTATDGTARAFVLPDAPDVPIDLIRNADRRVLLTGYTFASQRVTRALKRAADRGVDVRVLLDGEPVDGLTRRGARLLDSLVARGVDVRLVGGPRRRYAFHHAKYAVADDRAVVLTENWKPSGTGGHSSRGWGVVVSQDRIVAELATLFRGDANWTAATPWRQFRRGRSFAAGGSAANGTYPRKIVPKKVSVERTRLLVAPDNAGEAVTRVIDGATESVDVIQMTIDGPDQRFLRAAVRAARRGVEVRLLLSSAWYVREDNQRLVEQLRERAENEGLPLEAKLADPRGRYEKIHAKGVVVDDDQVIVGSLNWNGESVRQNREVMVLLEGEQAGTYYRRAFDADWGASGGASSLPFGSLAAVTGMVILAILVLRRIEFGDEVGVRPG